MGCDDQPERSPRWFLPISGDLHVGGRFQFENNAGGEISVYEPQRRVAATWENADKITWIAVELTPVADGKTRLTLEHTHLEGDFWDKFGPGAVGVGWDGVLRGLELHLASGGKALDPAKVMAWALSDEGKGFSRASAEDWGHAAIADGDDPEKAKKAVAQSIAFYTNEAC